MALPLAFAACTNDEFESNSMSQVQNGELVTLPDNYLLAGVMGGDAATRSIYEETAFAWLPFDGKIDEIGLCWRGGEYTSNGSVVYTNYKFTHYGWLGKDEVKPDLDCNGDLLNGQLLTALSDNEDDLLAGEWAVGDISKYPGLKVDAKNGLFHTDNSTIFKGDYIVYYPYNDKFAEVGNIPATAPANIKRDINELTDKNYTKELAKEVFVAGTMNGVDGGQQNGVFSTNFVSGGIVVKIKNTGTGDLNIHKVILLADNGFATEVKLDAAKIAAGAKGAALYAEEPSEFANTLVAEFYDSNKSNAQADLNIKSNETQRVAFAVLPTTTSTALKNAKVLLVNKQGNSYLVESNLQKLISLAEGWNVIEVSAKPANFERVAYAYDTESLIQELIKHNPDQAVGKGQTINVLNKITLDPEYSFKMNYGGDTEGKLVNKFKRTDRSIYIGEDLTLTGKGSIVVPANLQLVFKSVGTEDKPVTVKFDIPVITENKGCCGDYNGTIVFRTASEKYGKYEFSKIQNEGTIYLGSDLNGAVNITVDELVNNGGLVNAYGVNKANAEKSSQVTINKLTNTYVERDTETDSEKANNGRINIVAKFWNPATEQKEAAVEGQTKCMNVTIGELTNNEGAYVLVGKRTYLDVVGASTNAGKIKVETASVQGNTEDGQMHIDGSISNTGLIENYGVINNEGSLANADENGEIVDHVGCQFGGNKITAEPGEYICDVEDTNVDKDGDRLAYALGTNMPTTTVRFVGNSGTEKADGNENYYLYDLNRYTANLKDKNFIVATTNVGGVKLQGVYGLSNPKVGASVTIGGKLTVEKGTALEISKIQLTVNGVVSVNGDMTIVSAQTGTPATTDNVNAFTAKADVNVNGEKDNKASFTVDTYAKTAMNSNLNIANKYSSATFKYATYSEIANVLNINGTFTRIVSTGGQTANPAQVWCGSYMKGADAVIPNGLPQQR